MMSSLSGLQPGLWGLAVGSWNLDAAFLTVGLRLFGTDAENHSCIDFNYSVYFSVEIHHTEVCGKTMPIKKENECLKK